MNRRTVLFDFDGTLVRGDCAARFLREKLRRSLLRRVVATATLPPLAPLFGWWRSAGWAASFYTWLSTVGCDDAELLVARELFLARCAARREALLIAPALRRLHEHLDAGDRVVIVTGAEGALARGLWQALGGPEVELIGSRLERRYGGWVAAEHCVGPRKLAALERIGLRPPFAVSYSDSARDLPLLRAAERAVLVEPSARHLARVRRELGAVEVLRQGASEPVQALPRRSSAPGSRG